MGKSASKYKLQNIISFEEILEAINISPINVLLELGKCIANTDYAVIYYNNKNHSEFYKNVDKLKRAIKHSLAIGAFNHREKAIKILYENDLFTLTEEQYNIFCARL